jgi:hypothetical protein
VVAVCKARIMDGDEVTDIRLTGDPQPWADRLRHLYLRLIVRDLTGRRIGGDVLAPAGPLPSGSPATTWGSRGSAAGAVWHGPVRNDAWPPQNDVERPTKNCQDAHGTELVTRPAFTSSPNHAVAASFGSSRLRGCPELDW